MEEMRSLSIEGNSIAEIPYETFGVKNLIEELNLSNNNLRVLDATSFGKLEHLNNLLMNGNAIYAVDNHFLAQPRSLNNAYFQQNFCIDRNIVNFHSNREENMKAFGDCFDSFDKIPVGKN
jgi:Leucine-rich repeat (LRR) protein